jgi:hypothetical protein
MVRGTTMYDRLDQTAILQNYRSDSVSNLEFKNIALRSYREVDARQSDGGSSGKLDGSE